MKDNDKITLTYGQLKKLVKESKLDEAWFSKNEESIENKRKIAKIIQIYSLALRDAARHLSKLEEMDNRPDYLINDLDEALFKPLASGIEEIISKYLK